MKKINFRLRSFLSLPIYIYMSVLIGGIFFVDSIVFSKDVRKDLSHENEVQDDYVEARYKISKIKKVKDSFQIVFTRDSNDKLLPKKVMIVSQYIHHVLEEGMSLDISFRSQESTAKGIMELDQVLVYVPNEIGGGSTPIWMVSKNKEFMGLNGSKFLKMHSPTNDFSIF